MTATFAGLDLSLGGETKEDYGRWLIHGPQGAGKTTLASTIARLGKTLYIDLVGEKGTRSFRGTPYEKNIDIVRPKSITDLDDIYHALARGDHEYKAVVIDSVTAVQKMTMRYLLGHDETAVREIKQGTAPADMRTWGQALDVMTDLATFWYGLADGERAKPMHVVFTSQTKMNEDDLGNVTRVPDVQRGALSIMLATPDYVVYADVEENLEAISDDSEPPVKHILRFGADTAYRTKARLPFDLRGKIPTILGRKNPADLAALSKVLGVGGVESLEQKKKPAAKKAATTQGAK